MGRPIALEIFEQETLFERQFPRKLSFQLKPQP